MAALLHLREEACGRRVDDEEEEPAAERVRARRMGSRRQAVEVEAIAAASRWPRRERKVEKRRFFLLSFCELERGNAACGRVAAYESRRRAARHRLLLLPGHVTQLMWCVLPLFIHVGMECDNPWMCAGSFSAPSSTFF